MLEVEIQKISIKYEKLRLKDKTREKYLLESIMENGLKEPLQCVYQDDQYILLDGFKRLRICYKLKIHCVPVTVAGDDVAESILHLIRLSNEKTLNILEQAGFVDELKREFKLSASEIAKRLERSVAWVSVRLGILAEMSESVRQEVFSGRFPLRSYMYTIRQFTRVNKVPVKQTDQFVKAVSGKGLSQRNIEKLAYMYFRGNEQNKKQIDAGNLDIILKQLRGEEQFSSTQDTEINKEEADIIRNLEICRKYIIKVRSGLTEKKEGSEVFKKTVKLLIGGILELIDVFRKEMQIYHDRG